MVVDQILVEDSWCYALNRGSAKQWVFLGHHPRPKLSASFQRSDGFFSASAKNQ